MKLTGNCKDHFYNWYEENAHISKFNKTRNVTIAHFTAQSEVCQNALIVEWLDSVGIYISIYRDFFFNDWYFKILGHCEKSHFQSRTDATNAAIEKASTIYNET